MHQIFKISNIIILKKGHKKFGNWPGKVVKIGWTKTAKSINGG